MMPLYKHQKHRRACDRTSDGTWALPGVPAIAVNPTGEAKLDMDTLGCRLLP